MANARRIAIAVVTVLGALRCGTVTDPAVRAARCLEQAASAHRQGDSGPFDWPCDLQFEGNALLVLHPAGELPDALLIAAGVPPVTVPAIRSLRLGPWEAIFVVPLEGAERSSRTTYQARFVSIPQPVAATLSSSRVTFTLRSIGQPAAGGVSLEVINAQ